MRLLDRFRKAQERPKLDPEVKKWYREIISVENDLAQYFPPGTVPDDHKARFWTFQCDFCKGIHAGNCPAIAEIEHYETGAVKRIQFKEEWDTLAIITFDDVFSDDEVDG